MQLFLLAFLKALLNVEYLQTNMSPIADEFLKLRTSKNVVT